MDERVKELIYRVRQTAETGARAGTTARWPGCAGNLVDVTKLNLQIFDLRRRQRPVPAGRKVVYTAHWAEDTDDEVLEAILSELDVKNAQTRS